jgi:hypothetical protein
MHMSGVRETTLLTIFLILIKKALTTEKLKTVKAPTMNSYFLVTKWHKHTSSWITLKPAT